MAFGSEVGFKSGSLAHYMLYLAIRKMRTMLKKRFQDIFILTIFVLLPAVFVLVNGFRSINSTKVTAHIVKGVFSIPDSLSHQKYFGLNGEAEFYWNKLLTPSQLDSSDVKPDGYLHIPGLWNGMVVDGQKVGGRGYATIRFWMNLPPGASYGIKFREYDCAYKVWVNGKLRLECGNVGKSRAEERPSWIRKTLFFYSWDRSNEVVIQMSNFRHWKGGPEDTMIFGKASDIITLNEAMLALSYFIFGVILVMGLYHFVLYVFRRKDRSSLIFSLFCLVVNLRLFTTGEKMIYRLFPDFDWLIALKLEYFSFILVPPIFLNFIRQIYPHLLSRAVMKLSYALALLFSVMVIVLPSEIFTYIPIVYQVIVFACGSYIFYILIYAFIRKEENSVVLVGSYFFFFIIMLNDIFYYNRFIDSTFLMPVGVFIIVFTQALVLSKKTSLTFKEVEVLTDKLKLYNKELEDKIADRTKEITTQKQEIEKQAIELQQTNEQLKRNDRLRNALTAMIVHDLKNPLNMVLNYSNDERITSAGQQMLTLVQNILDIQKYENDRMLLNKQPTPISTILSKSIFSVTYVANQKAIRIYSGVPSNLVFDVDADVMERVFTNLLTNALKYTPINSTISLCYTEEGQQACFSIIDKGPGIPEDKKQLVFEKFGTYNEKVLGRVKPTGLGLAFCKMAVEAHGGTIGFESEMGVGTRMWFTLPLPVFRTEVGKEPSNEERSVSQAPLFHEGEAQEFARCVDELRMLEVHEVTRIRQVLSRSLFNENADAARWKARVLSAVWAGNELLFRKLLND